MPSGGCGLPTTEGPGHEARAQVHAGSRERDRDGQPAVRGCRGRARPRLAAAGPAGTAGAAGSGSTTPAEVRVNQVGYATGSPKVAFVMLPGKVGQVSFTVSGGHGVVFRGRSSTDAGSWNAAYGAVYRLDFTGLDRAGTYRITARAGRATAVSPAFAVAPAATLYHRLVLNGVRYFTSERDGAAVRSSVLDRQPANLTDRYARGVRRPAVRQQRQPPRHLPPDRRPGERVRRLVRRGRRVREVRLHRQLRRRAAAARRAGLPRHLPDAGQRGRVRAALAGEAVAPGQEGPLHPGRHRQRQREQHHPGRLQLLVPAAGRGPA